MFFTLNTFIRKRKIGEEENKYVYHSVYFYEKEKNRRRGRKKYVYHIEYFHENEKNRRRGRKNVYHNVYFHENEKNRRRGRKTRNTVSNA